MRLGLAFVAALVVVTAAAAGPFPKIASVCSRTDFRSVGTTIRADFCPAEGTRTSGAAVVVLHGCGGFGTIDQLLARDLPRHGIATFYVDYFGATPPPSRKGFCDAHRAIESDFPIWEQITVSATAALKREPGVDAQRVGAVGWSLGGALAILTAEDESAQHPFRALALFSAAAFGPALQNVRALPPTLILSGGKGDVIPVADAVALYRALRRAHVATVLHVYPHGNHQWKHAQGAAGERWTVDFLDRYLLRG